MSIELSPSKRLRLSTITNSSQQTNCEKASISSNDEPAALNIIGTSQQQPSFLTQTEAIVPMVSVSSSSTTRTEATGLLACELQQQQQTIESVDQSRQPVEVNVPILDVDEPLRFERPEFAQRIVMPLPMEEIKEEQEDDEMEWENFENKENNDPN